MFSLPIRRTDVAPTSSADRSSSELRIRRGPRSRCWIDLCTVTFPRSAPRMVVMPTITVVTLGYLDGNETAAPEEEAPW